MIECHVCGRLIRSAARHPLIALIDHATPGSRNTCPAVKPERRPDRCAST